LLAAALDEGQDEYFWTHLSAPSMHLAANANTRATVRNDERQARCGVYDLNALGNIPGTSSGDQRITDAAAELADHENAPKDDIARKLRRLLVVHRDEWRTFVAAQKSESFLNKWLEVLQC
jgi:hypothetical protein